MTHSKRKRNAQKKHIRSILSAVFCVLLLLITVIGIHQLTGFLGKTPDSGTAQNKTNAQAPGFLVSGMMNPSKALASMELSPENTDPANTDQADSTQTEPSEPNTPGTSHTLDNPQIDISSLDNASQDWGPGSDSNEKNQPYSALSYQEKYGKYNANFIVPDSNKVYLTFDEGYENGCTPAILDTLKEKNVKAVFFVTSQFAKQNPDLVQRMIDEGHTVGNHSVTHPSKGLPSQTVEQQQNEVMKLHDYIKENFNYEMHLFRYPAGKFSEQSLAIVNNCNYKSVFWSFAYLDYDTENQPEPAKALEKVKSRLHPGAIYLLHAVSTTNTAILGDFIDYIRAQGYELGQFD